MGQQKKKIYGAVRNSVDKIKGFDIWTAIVIDGAPAMTEGKSGFGGLLIENNVTCPTIHCIIHQDALSGKSVKQSEVFKGVIAVIRA